MTPASGPTAPAAIPMGTALEADLDRLLKYRLEVAVCLDFGRLRGRALGIARHACGPIITAMTPSAAAARPASERSWRDVPATRVPYEWTPKTTLFAGRQLIDVTLQEIDGRCSMFANTPAAANTSMNALDGSGTAFCTAARYAGDSPVMPLSSGVHQRGVWL